MKLSRFQSAFIAFLCSAGFLHADVVVLKNGNRMEGNITAETPTSVRMRYKATAKIWDDKEIPRTDIAEIIKQKPEEVEIIELRKELPTKDLMTAEKYEGLIQDRLRPFVNRYPGTKEAKEAEEMITKLQDEKEKVVAGGIKMEGKWLTADEAKAQAYNIRAYEIYAAMRERIAAKDYVGALKEFDKMAPPQQNSYGMQQNTQAGFGLSVYYPKAVEEIVTVLTNFQGQLDQMIKDQPTLKKAREDNLARLIEPDLGRTRTAIKKEEDQARDTAAAERKNSRWFTPYKYDLASLQSLSTLVSAEKARLALVDTAKLAKVNEAVGRIMAAAATAGKDQAALRAMGEAITEGQNYIGGLDAQNAAYYASVFQTYRDYYMAYYQQLTAKMAPGAPAPGSNMTGSSAIGGTNAPAEDSRVAAALAAAQGVGQPQAAAPAPQQPGAMPAGTAPAQPGAAPQQAPAAAAAPGAVQPGAPAAGYPAAQPGAVAPATAVPQAQPAYAQPAAAVAPAPEEEGMSTMTMLLIGVGVVVLVLVVAMSSGKKKKKAE